MITAKHKNKLIFILFFLILLSSAFALILFALKENINLFYTPTQLKNTHVPLERTIRIGGYVKAHSLIFHNNGETVNFIVTDKKNEIAIQYQGILPNLFREGQTVVIQGKLDQTQTLMATEVLAKHDEKYMPKEQKNKKREIT